MKMLIAGLAALFMVGTATAQGQRRPPQQPTPDTPPIRVQERAAPPLTAVAPPVTAENSWVLDLSDGGRVVIQLRPDHAPNHVERIKMLTRRGFYNGLTFHRVVEGFMAQGGDPSGTGAGQSDLPDLAAEFNALPHLRGSVAMARTQEENSANSQFYIMFVPRLSMDREYTVFGRVVSGMEHVDRIQRGQPPANPTRIVRASIGSDNVPPPTAEEIAAVMQTPLPGPAQPAAPALISPAPADAIGTPAPAGAQQGPQPAPADQSAPAEQAAPAPTPQASAAEPAPTPQR